MGKNTRYFRQSRKSLSGSKGAQIYAKVNRMGSWYNKITQYLKLKTKKGDY